jgi:DNA-binding response OmpR family regulator
MEEGHHILVVDDLRDIRDLLAVYLKKLGFSGTTADDSIATRCAVEKFDSIWSCSIS